MPGEAVEKLSAKQALALHTLFERTFPGGPWMAVGTFGLRGNTIDSLERRGLASRRTYHPVSTTAQLWDEAQITARGQEWVEAQYPVQ